VTAASGKFAMSPQAVHRLSWKEHDEKERAMTYVNVLPSLHVADFHAVVDWYSGLFGREPDRRPMDGDVEWQLTESGGLQVFRNPDSPARTTVILGVDDLAAELATLKGRGIAAEPFDAGGGRYRLAQLVDPAGNVIILSQSMA
jgi:predicted enzyme related to lactoylglutathione lyase